MKLILNNPEDQMFWERLDEMPWIEAEQECVLRREKLILENNMIMVEMKKSRYLNYKLEFTEIYEEHQKLNTTISFVNERIKFYRSRLNEVRWKEAVRKVLGEEAMIMCREWIITTEVNYQK